MSRYFFDVVDGFEVRDEVGRELKRGAILRDEALRVIGRIMATQAEDGKESSLILTVRDVFGATALRVRLVCQVENF